MLVMFVCQANVGRSQVAEAYFERLSQHEVCSSGLRVDEEMARNKPATAKMKDNSRHSLPYMLERGIDISEKERTQITPELIARRTASSPSCRQRRSRRRSRNRANSRYGTFRTRWTTRTRRGTSST